MPRESYYLPERRLVNQQDAALVATPKVPRSKFVGSWTRKTAMDAGLLYPILIDEVLPGDHLTYDVTAYVRMATPLFPLFDNQRIDTHFFYVPSRILWDKWERIMGFQADPGDVIDLNVPKVEIGEAEATIGSLYDHFGLPTEGQINPAPAFYCVQVLPMRAYNMIWNKWFRDQNLQDSVEENTTSDGPDDPDDYVLLRRNKFHDYFTSALPWPQKFESPEIPLSGLAPVQGLGLQAAGVGGPAGAFLETGGGTPTYGNPQTINAAGTLPVGLVIGVDGLPVTGEPQIFADLSQIDGITIGDFRQAMLLQELLERDARGGTRYIEVIKNHFGVNSPDARLQRPEYIGGGSTPLMITPIAQTAPTTGAPLGALGAAGSAAGSHHASYAATEHGYIIGLLSIRTELSYQQGTHRMWFKEDRYDFYWPTLAGLSEQEIRQGELFRTANTTLDFATFGYQERWQEYRTRYSEVCGIMRSYATGTLDAWHLAQEFSPAPALNSGFIEDDPPMDRVLAAGSLAVGQQYLADILYKRTAIRPIPTYGIPASLTHF